jgi:hypothetical protein
MEITPKKSGEQEAVESAPHFADDPKPGEVQAWEEIETGRYMPRRIRGSYQGRALG